MSFVALPGLQWWRRLHVSLALRLFAWVYFLLPIPFACGQSSTASFAMGSVPSGQASSAPVSLSLETSIQMALHNNLAILESSANHRISRGQRLIALSSMLPSVNAGVTEHVVQENLVTYGIHIPGVSPIQGPYQYEDVRGSYSQTLLSAASFQRLRSAKNAEEAASLSVTDAQEIIVLTTGVSYLAVIQAESHVQASTAQVENAEALYKQALNALNAGAGARIDVTRTEVQLETEQYNLRSAHNALDIAKLTLARIIGLPVGQDFDLSDACQLVDRSTPTLQTLLKHATAGRADLAAEERAVRAASRSLAAVKDQRLPELNTAADYGANGTTFGRSHGTFDFQVGINVPVFTGGRIKGEIEEAKATLAQRQAEFANMAAQIDFEVRAAYLNLNASGDQVKVARHNVELASENLLRSRNRFENGVADSVEVVQAEQSLAAANDQLISSTYSLNVAKLNLARATGSVRTDWKFLLGGK